MHEHTISSPTQRERCLVLFLAFALCVMLMALLKERFLHPSLIVHLPGNSMQFTASKETVTQDMDEVAALMQSLRLHPNDTQVLLRLVQIFMERGEWETAETFARRTLQETPGSFQGNFLLGIILHQEKKDVEAAASLEHAILLKDDGPTRYSLGVLYCYYLNQKEKGLAHLNAALNIPDLADDLKKTITEEIAKQTTR